MCISSFISTKVSEFKSGVDFKSSEHNHISAGIHLLISENGNIPPGYDKLLPAYHEALKLYRNQDWVKAIDAFKESDKLEDMFPGRKTNPSRIYIPRCEHYRDNPPGDDWDGSWALTKK